MSADQYRALLAPPDSGAAAANALTSVNAAYKSWDQFDARADTDGALDDAQARADELDDKLAASQRTLHAFLAETRANAQAHLTTAQELALLRHSIADELDHLSQELVSSMSDERGRHTLLEDIEDMHRGLKELQSVRDYVQAVAHALALSESAVNHLANSATALTLSHRAITDYQTLDTFVGAVARACAGAEDSALGAQALHLVTFLEGVRDRTWTDMKGALASTLVAAAEALNWPMPVDYAAASPAERKAFEDAFAALLRLQELGEKIPAVTAADGAAADKAGLYPLQALAQPVALRFKFHFEGTRKTNRLDKPEWYFTHILNAAHEHHAFMDSVAQALLRNTPYRALFAWREFVHALLPPLARKLRRSVPAVLHLPALLAHTVYQALAFDAALRAQGFDLPGTRAAQLGGDPDGTWEGMSEVVLGRETWFAAWLEGERKFAEDQYEEIVGAPDAWMLVDDAGDEGASDAGLRPTNSARRVKLLVEQVTDRYAPLPSALHRTRFLAGAQLPLLAAYRARIGASLDAFETLSSSLVRAVPGALGLPAAGAGSGAEQGVTWGGAGADARRLTAGVDGAQRLAKALLSARYLADAMRAWGEDLFFLELWADICRRPALRVRAETSDLLPPPTGTGTDKDSTPENTLFDALVEQYDALVTRAEGMLVQHVYAEVEAGLRAHLNAQTTSAQMQEADDLQLPSTLLAPVALLSSHLTFLASALPPALAAAVYRAVAGRLATHVLQRQILFRGRARLSARAGRALRAEAELWADTCARALGGAAPGARAQAPWRRLLTAARVLGAEDGVWRKLVLVTLGGHDDAAWRDAVADAIGVCELNREEVAQVIRTRVDGDNVL